MRGQIEPLEARMLLARLGMFPVGNGGVSDGGAVDDGVPAEVRSMGSGEGSAAGLAGLANAIERVAQHTPPNEDAGDEQPLTTTTIVQQVLQERIESRLNGGSDHVDVPPPDDAIELTGSETSTPAFPTSPPLIGPPEVLPPKVESVEPEVTESEIEVPIVPAVEKIVSVVQAIQEVREADDGSGAVTSVDIESETAPPPVIERIVTAVVSQRQDDPQPYKNDAVEEPDDGFIVNESSGETDTDRNVRPIQESTGNTSAPEPAEDASGDVVQTEPATNTTDGSSDATSPAPTPVVRPRTVTRSDEEPAANGVSKTDTTLPGDGSGAGDASGSATDPDGNTVNSDGNTVNPDGNVGMRTVDAGTAGDVSNNEITNDDGVNGDAGDSATTNTLPPAYEPADVRTAVRQAVRLLNALADAPEGTKADAFGDAIGEKVASGDVTREDVVRTVAGKILDAKDEGDGTKADVAADALGDFAKQDFGPDESLADADVAGSNATPGGDLPNGGVTGDVNADGANSDGVVTDGVVTDGDVADARANVPAALQDFAIAKAQEIVQAAVDGDAAAQARVQSAARQANAATGSVAPGGVVAVVAAQVAKNVVAQQTATERPRLANADVAGDVRAEVAVEQAAATKEALSGPIAQLKGASDDGVTVERATGVVVASAEADVAATTDDDVSREEEIAGVVESGTGAWLAAVLFGGGETATATSMTAMAEAVGYGQGMMPMGVGRLLAAAGRFGVSRGSSMWAEAISGGKIRAAVAERFEGFLLSVFDVVAHGGDGERDQAVAVRGNATPLLPGAILLVTMGKPLSRLAVAADGGEGTGGDAQTAMLRNAAQAKARRRRQRELKRKARGAAVRASVAQPVPGAELEADVFDLLVLSHLESRRGTGDEDSRDAMFASCQSFLAGLDEGGTIAVAVSAAAATELVGWASVEQVRKRRGSGRTVKKTVPKFTGTTVVK